MARMRPGPRTGPFALEGDIVWTADGEALEEPYAGASPCEQLSRQVFDAPDGPQVADLALASLLVPGTRADYLEAIRFATTHLGTRGDPRDFLLELQEAGMALIEADPVAARQGGRRGRDAEEIVRAPYLTAARVLLKEGLTAAAAAIEAREEASLGERVGPAGRPATDALDGLREVWQTVHR